MYMCVCMYVCMYACIYVSMNAYMYFYVHPIYPQQWDGLGLFKGCGYMVDESTKTGLRNP